jgi:lipoprotein-anchoring transpeptidase ErfK/SrfK
MKRFRTLVQFGVVMIVSLGLMLATFVEDSHAGPKKALLVNVHDQVLYAVDDFKIVYEFDVITGRPGKETTAGKFTVFKKFEDYTSKTYKVEMPYTMFFSKDGKAVHGTKWATLRSYLHAYITESVGSMGCVGLTEDDARTLFGWTPVGTPVVILDEATEDRN